MRIYKEIVTVLAVSQMDKDKVGVVGINEKGKWIRALHLYKGDLVDEEGKNIIKPFSQTELYFFRDGREWARSEDRLVFLDELRKPLVVNELNNDEQKQFLDMYLDDSIASIFNNHRTIGIIKPIIDQVEFGWSSLRNDHVARFRFRDNKGEKYDFLCTEYSWRNYWINFMRSEPRNYASQLLEMNWKLNDNDTYFVVGLTENFPEMPGPFKGRWPMILGVHSLSSVLDN